MENIKPVKIDTNIQNNLKINNTISNNQSINNFQNIKPVQSELVNFEDYLNNKNVSNNSVENKTEIKQAPVNQSTIDRDRILNAVGNTLVRTAATNVVTRIKVASGVYDVVEHIADGLLWTGGKVTEGGSYVISQVAGLFDKDTKQSILNWREDAKDWTKDAIAYGVVDNMEDALFNTEFGKALNDASYMKHDSLAANRIENITKVGVELAGATAATIATGGAASPTMIAVVGGLGFAEGAGQKAQETYQESLKTTGTKEAGIAFSGVANGASWVAKGLFGAATIQQIGNIGNIASQSGSLGNLGKAARETLTVHKNRSRIAYIIRTRNEYRSTQNLVDTVGSVFDTLSESIDKKDSVGRTATKVGVGLVTNIAINRLFDIGSLWARDLRPASSIAEITGVKDTSLKKTIKSTVQALIEQVDTFIDSGFYETGLENQTIDNVFDRLERSN